MTTGGDACDSEGQKPEIDWISGDLSLGGEPLVQRLEDVARVMGAGGARLALHHPASGVVYLETGTGRLPSGADRLETLARAPLAARAVAEGRPLAASSWEGDPQVVAALVAPLREARLEGHLALFRYQGEPFADADEAVVGLVARLLTTGLVQARALELERQRADGLAILAGLTGLVTSQLELAKVETAAIETAIELLDCEAASLLLLDEKGRELHFAVAVGEKGEAVRRVRLQASEGVAGWVVQNDQAFLTNAAPCEPLHSGRVDAEVGFETRQLLAVPVRIGGRVLGCLEALNSRRSGGFRQDEIPIFQSLANQVAVAVENARLYGELRRRAETIENQQEALLQSEKLSAMGQLSAGVAHEIRSPLSAISGYAQLIRRRKPDESILKPVKTIEDAASHINRIVNGLLDFARKEEPRYEPVHVHEVLERTLVLARSTLERYRQVVVVQDLAEGLPKVTGDRRQLQQVFLNLVLNAAQSMNDGGTLTIRTFGEPPAGEPPAGEEATGRIGRVVVLFGDTGSGISKDDQNRVFQPFFTTGKEGGMGLGLSICRSIVQNHRGAINFETEPGEGTTFRVHLPAEGW